MRGIELVVGSLLVASGVLGPAAVGPGGSIPFSGEVGAEAVFPAWEQNGNATVDASTAALQAKGPVTAAIEGAVGIQIVEFEATHRLHTQAGPFDVNSSRGEISTVASASYENATVSLQGESDAKLMAWANETLGPASFKLSLANESEASVFPSPGTTWWTTQGGQHSHILPTPLLALGHGGYESRHLTLAEVSFEHLVADGGVQLFALGTSTIQAEQTTGTETFRTWEEEGQGASMGTTEIDVGATIRYAVITLRGATAHVPFEEDEDVQAAFLTREATWNLDGTLDFTATNGTLHTANANRTLNNDTVEIEGNTTMRTTSKGFGGLEQETPVVKTGAMIASPDERVVAEMDSDADAVAVNGQQLEIPEPPPVPEEATFLSKLVGFLLLAWALVRRGFVFVVAGSQHRALVHPRRRRIHAFLEEEGLAHMRAIERATGIPVGSLGHHLEVLEDNDLVTSVRDGERHVYFHAPSVRGYTRSQLRSLSLLAEPTRLGIANALAHHAPLTQADLQDQLEISQPTVSQQLDRMVEADLATRRGQRGITYRPAPLLERWLVARTHETGTPPEPPAEPQPSHA